MSDVRLKNEGDEGKYACDMPSQKQFAERTGRDAALAEYASMTCLMSYTDTNLCNSTTKNEQDDHHPDDSPFRMRKQAEAAEAAAAGVGNSFVASWSGTGGQKPFYNRMSAATVYRCTGGALGGLDVQPS
jgi:hypothetical protein